MTCGTPLPTPHTPHNTHLNTHPEHIRIFSSHAFLRRDNCGGVCVWPHARTRTDTYFTLRLLLFGVAVGSAPSLRGVALAAGEVSAPSLLAVVLVVGEVSAPSLRAAALAVQRALLLQRRRFSFGKGRANKLWWRRIWRQACGRRLCLQQGWQWGWWQRWGSEAVDTFDGVAGRPPRYPCRLTCCEAYHTARWVCLW